MSPSVLAKLGDTHVLCKVSSAVCEPHPVRKNEGFLLFKVNLDILKGRAGLKKTCQQFAQEYTEILEQSIRDSK